MLLEVS